MAGVVVGCLTATTSHLVLEAATRYHRGTPHIGVHPLFVWLSQGKMDLSFARERQTGILLLPDIIVFLLVSLAVRLYKVRDRAKTQSAGGMLARYRFALLNSGANGRLTSSIYTILAFVVIVIRHVYPSFVSDLDPGNGTTLPDYCWLGRAFSRCKPVVSSCSIRGSHTPQQR